MFNKVIIVSGGAALHAVVDWVHVAHVQVCFGTKPRTVTSMAEAVVVGPLAAAGGADSEGSAASGADAQQFTFVDYPGHPRLRGRALYSHAGAARGVVFVVDSTKSDPDSMRLCAEYVCRRTRPLNVLALTVVVCGGRYLYDLFTNIQFVEQLPPVLIACHKSDLEGAASPSKLRTELEAALYAAMRVGAACADENPALPARFVRLCRELLKVTRASLGTTSEEDQALRLGRAGQPFSFQVDSPGEVEFCVTSIEETEGLAGVREFIETCFDRE